MAKLKYKIPERMQELMAWVIALDGWDAGEPQRLCNLVENYPIPEELRKSVSKRLSGEIKQSANRKISSFHKWYVGFVIYTIRHLKEAERANAQALADAMKEEPEVIIKAANLHKDAVIAVTADDFGISKRTAEDYYAKFIQKIKDWPNL